MAWTDDGYSFLEVEIGKTVRGERKSVCRWNKRGIGKEMICVAVDLTIDV